LKFKRNQPSTINYFTNNEQQATDIHQPYTFIE